MPVPTLRRADPSTPAPSWRGPPRTCSSCFLLGGVLPRTGRCEGGSALGERIGVLAETGGIVRRRVRGNSMPVYTRFVQRCHPKGCITPRVSASGCRRLHLPQLLLQTGDLVPQPRGQLELQLPCGAVHLFRELLDQVRELGCGDVGQGGANRPALPRPAQRRRPASAGLAVPALEQLRGVEG